jgi:outer membrane receptor protein involved in Fe transport
LDYEIGDYKFGLTGAYAEYEYLAKQDYLMDVGATLEPTALNPTGYWPTSAIVGAVGGEFTDPTCNWDDGTAGIFGGCILDVDTTRIFAYDHSSSESDYWTIEAKFASSFDGPFNFIVGASTYEGKSAGDYYVVANTLDLVGVYGVAPLGFPPLYPTLFNSTGDPGGSNESDGWAAFAEVYYDFNEDIKLTVGVRYNDDNKETFDTGILYNAISATAVGTTLPGFLVGAGLLDPDYLTNDGEGTNWTRTLNILLGPLGGAPETDLALYHGVTQAELDAAAATPAYSAERFAVSDAVPPTPGFNETRVLTGSPSTASWDEISGRIGIDWNLNENSMLYAFFSRGYKPGGFNPPINPDFQAETSFTFDSEEIDSFEVGLKNTLLDGGLILNGSFFVYDYTGLQVTRIANNTSINDNIDADIMGLELETFWVPESIPNLVIDASYSWLDTEVASVDSTDPVNRTAGNPDWILLNNIDPGSTTAVNYVAVTSEVLPLVDQALAENAALSDANGQAAPGTTYPNGIPAYFSRNFLEENGAQTSNGLPFNLGGNQLPNAPEHTIHLGVAYTFNLSYGDLTARWDYYWQDDSYAREFNSRGDQIDSWDQHNASLELRSTDQRWIVRAWVRNIQDEDNVTGKYLTSDTSGFYRNYFLTDPRIYGASVRYSFAGE